MTPAVSVITIFHNAEPFLQEAIDSVRAQTLHNWELLLVDDGSADSSSEIARQAAASDPSRIRYLEHPGHANLGMSAARNLGLSHARAPVVGFLDADDIYLPDKLAEQLALLEQHADVGMVYGPMELWNSWKSDVDPAVRDAICGTGFPAGVVLEPPQVFLAYVRRKVTTPAVCGILVRRAAVERVGGFDPGFTGLYEDQVFFYKIALHERILVTDRVLDRYRQHESSATARALATGEWSLGTTNVALDRFFAWLRAYACTEPAHARLIRREARRARLRYLWSTRRAVRAMSRVRRETHNLVRRALRRFRPNATSG